MESTNLIHLEKSNTLSTEKKLSHKLDGIASQKYILVYEGIFKLYLEKLGIIKIGAIMKISGLQRFQSTFNINDYFSLNYFLSP